MWCPHDGGGEEFLHPDQYGRPQRYRRGALRQNSRSSTRFNHVPTQLRLPRGPLFAFRCLSDTSVWQHGRQRWSGRLFGFTSSRHMCVRRYTCATGVTSKSPTFSQFFKKVSFLVSACRKKNSVLFRSPDKVVMSSYHVLFIPPSPPPPPPPPPPARAPAGRRRPKTTTPTPRNSTKKNR